ncbi:MAG: hypothetical protein HGA55_01540 [Methanoregulaceae archaeon]|jgi:hypothetical protein|nr:hypothetical protein [Methanoregulaceae archaeon]
MNYREVLTGKEKPFEIYDDISAALSDIRQFTDLVEPIYRKAMLMDEEGLDRLRFALVRVQIFSDIHRNEDMEQAQKLKYVSQVLEKVIFGSLILEGEAMGHD